MDLSHPPLSILFSLLPMFDPIPARCPGATHMERIRFGRVLECGGGILFARSVLAAFLSPVPTA